MSSLERDLITLAIDLNPRKPGENLHDWVQRIVEQLPKSNPWKEDPHDRKPSK